MFAAEEAPTGEQWNWKKFFLGFFDGKNYGKAVVQMFCITVLLVIGFSLYSAITSRFSKPTSTVGANSGIVLNDNSNKKSFSLLNLFNFK